MTPFSGILSQHLLSLSKFLPKLDDAHFLIYNLRLGSDLVKLAFTHTGFLSSLEATKSFEVCPVHKTGRTQKKKHLLMLRGIGLLTQAKFGIASVAIVIAGRVQC